VALTSGSRVSQANPAEDLATLINTAITAHSNWQFVEDYTVSTTKWSVYKCLGAGNSIGSDYYVFFNRLTTAGTTVLYGPGAAETYTTGTHSYGHPCPVPSTSNATPASDGSSGGATVYALAATQQPTTLQAQDLTTSTSAYDYWIAVNNDGLWIGTRVSTTNYGAIVGPLDSLVDTPATNDPFPLAQSYLRLASNNSNTYASTSRHALVTTAQPRMWGLINPATSADIYVTWPNAALVGAVGGTGELYQAGKAVGARVVAMTWAGCPSVSYGGNQAASVVGRNRGLWRHLLSYSLGAGVVIGDTVTVGAATYMYTGFVYNSTIAGLFYETSAT
jgi:hypothetical protein